ncbi:hypothetical protein OWV82_015474 [Melia azedarach]|uniref:Uncharacterized protein n=1 Tax=Melia azedarach TaxID=155640 RepID=A0ACC1XRM2_MELAZ|nr:hypothetical protein OWV82_015474 [Melia azedarach]
MTNPEKHPSCLDEPNEKPEIQTEYNNYLQSPEHEHEAAQETIASTLIDKLSASTDEPTKYAEEIKASTNPSQSQMSLSSQSIDTVNDIRHREYLGGWSFKRGSKRMEAMFPSSEDKSDFLQDIDSLERVVESLSQLQENNQTSPNEPTQLAGSNPQVVKQTTPTPASVPSASVSTQGSKSKQEKAAPRLTRIKKKF